MHQFVRIPPSYDPYTQPILFTVPLNSTIAYVVPVDLGAVDIWNQYAIRICVNYASQLGASVSFLVVTIIMLGSGQLKSVVPVLNMLTLVFNILRNLFLMLYFTGGWYAFYTYFGHDFGLVSQRDLNLSFACNVWTTLEEMSLVLSLSLQVWAIFKAEAMKYKVAIAIVLVPLGLLLLGLRFALMVLNNMAISHASPFVGYKWLAADEQYVLTTCIFCFSAAFVYKLLQAIWRRRKLGIRQFSAMEILFIFGLQTMIIPAIFSVLQFYTDVPELGSQILTITALLLPLSSLWANASQNHGTYQHTHSTATNGSSWFSRMIKSQFSSVTARTNSEASSIEPQNGVPSKECSTAKYKDMDLI